MISSITAFQSHTDKWATWHSGNYGKTVRRAKTKYFDKIVESLDSFGVQYSEIVSSDTSCAVAFEPMTYEQMPKVLRKCQVSGLDLPNDIPLLSSSKILEEVESFKHGVVVVVDDSLGLSTGKIAAQCAHGMWFGVDIDSVNKDDLPLFSFYRTTHEDFVKVCDVADHVVTDSGLTELSGPTDTVAVLVR